MTFDILVVNGNWQALDIEVKLNSSIARRVFSKPYDSITKFDVFQE